MDLYLIRHADAKPLGEDNVHEDANRALTETGHAQAKAVGAAFQRLGKRINAVVTSPLLRARQTAEGVIGELDKPAPELLTSQDLGPGGKRRKLSRFLRNQGSEVIALVGHQPDLNHYAAWLIGSKKAQIDLEKAGVAYIHCPDGPRKKGGILTWLVTPHWMGA
ncbi:MAG: phosphohistidine phosphatase SixA [Gemmataceae bacterium]